MTRVLTERQIRLFSRQVILRELGQAGQAQLCAASVAAADGGDAAATSVALDYLRRAGVQVLDGEAAGALPVAVPAPEDVDPTLRACAQWLAGAWTAVETIKQCTGVGSPAAAAPALAVFTQEVD